MYLTIIYLAHVQNHLHHHLPVFTVDLSIMYIYIYVLQKLNVSNADGCPSQAHDGGSQFEGTERSSLGFRLRLLQKSEATPCGIVLKFSPRYVNSTK